MEIHSSCHNRELTIRLVGDLDHHAAKNAMTKIDQQIDMDLPLVTILDFGGVTFMDSSGIAVLLRAYRRMTEAGGGLIVQDVPSQPKRVLQAAGLTKLISFC